MSKEQMIAERNKQHLAAIRKQYEREHRERVRKALESWK